MKALILDGSLAHDGMADRLVTTLRAQLGTQAYEVEHVPLRERRIGNCAGDFFCWVRNPGVCMTDDDNRALAAKMVQCDLLILLSPVTFGGYSSTLKRMLDHMIQNIMPFFTQIDGEVHHKARYGRYPNLLVIGWMDEPDATSETVFRHLVKRNAINMYARTTVNAVVYPNQSAAELSSQAQRWLEALTRGESTPAPALPSVSPSFTTMEPVRRAVLLVGSPRTTKSSSAALGNYLLEQLASRGATTQTFQIYTTLRAPQAMAALREAVVAADLVVLAFPLYIDSLPAPVIATLEHLAADRAKRSAGGKLVALTNCGFPEAHHCANALAVCAGFAREAGLAWAGGMALGAGEGVVHGTPLRELGGMARSVRRALDMAAADLAAGRPIPPAASELLTKPIIPSWLYRLVGSFTWVRMSRQHGAQHQLALRPYAKQE